MVSLVNLRHQVGDGQLKLVDPIAARVLLRSQTMALAKKKQNVSGLADEKPPCLEEGRCERAVPGQPLFHQPDHRRLVVGARDVVVVEPRLLERQADEFAAALNGGPIVELVAHAQASARTLQQPSSP